MTGPLTAILLAAGRGRRFGGNKIVARLPDGTAVGLAAAMALAKHVDRVLVVVGEEGGATETLFREAGFATVHAADAKYGMAHSLACGVGNSADSGAWLMALADMPYIATETIADLTAALRQGAPIVVPRYAGRAGHPVGFLARFRDDLLALKGDRGARDIIDQYDDCVRYIDTLDAGVTRDIDTQDELEAG